MNLVSNDKVKEILDKLVKVEFDVRCFIHANSLDETIIGDKIKYEYVSSYIKELDSEAIDVLRKNSNKCFDEYENIKNDIVMQIVNHVLLEIPRAVQFKELEDQAQRYRNQYRKSRDFQRNIESKNKEFDEKFGSIQSEFIAILSIFAAVIIGFFGGLNVIGSALSNMHNVSIYRLIFVIVILGMIMFNVIYMLLKEVGRLSGKGKHMVSINYNTVIDFVKCIINNYTYAFLYNITSILILIMIYLLYLIDKNTSIFIPMLNVVFVVIIHILLILCICFVVLKIKNESRVNINQDYNNDDSMDDEYEFERESAIE